MGEQTNEAQVEITLEDAYALAMMHMQQGNYRVADVTLRDILRSIPDHFDSLHHLGIVLYNLGNIDEALTMMQKASMHPAATAPFFSNYGILLNQAGRTADSLAAYDSAIALNASFADAYWNKSQALWLMGRYEDAEHAARTATVLKPDSAEAWLNLGTALAKRNQLADAITAWEKSLALRTDYSFALNNIGNALRDLGRLKEAEEFCRKALAQDPNNIQALNNLGNALLDQGDARAAEDLYRKAVQIAPDYVEAHNNLAICLIQQARFNDALVCARYAIAFDPHYADAYVNLSDILRTLGQFEEAEKAAQRAVMLRPDSAEAHMDLADVLFARDRYGDAEIELQKARHLQPESPRVYLRLSHVLERAGKIDEALEIVTKAVALNPEMPDAFIRQGVICHIAGKIAEAEASYLKAYAMNPQIMQTLLCLAELYQSMNEMETSARYLAQAKALNKNVPGLYTTLSKIKKFTADDEDFKTMLELEKTIESFGPDQTAALHFALFKAYEDIKDYERAFECLKKANDSKRKTLPFNRAEQKNSFDSLKKQHTPDFFTAYEGKGCASDVPIFIIGMPRSGTTLTEQIISSHHAVFGAGELQEIGLMEREFGRLTPDNARAMGQWYVDEVLKKDASGTAKHIVDKMPGNFMRLGYIMATLPHAKIIHCRRGAIDTCLSCYKQSFSRGQYWSYDLEELAEHYNLYLDLMNHWRTVMPGRFLEIDYEDTVSDMESQARRLIDFIGLPWDDACLEPHKQKRAILTASKMQVIRPVYQTSVKSWQRYETPLQVLIQGLKA